MIHVDRLSKRYPVAVKQTGLGGTLKHFFRRQYRTVEAVRQVSFQIEPGEVVGFLGPNETEKTTS
jgi:ABC-2 type transport system ATP-binding protein